MTTKITYSQLYSDMTKCFTINKNNTDYKLGDYMRAKAKSAQVKSKVSAKESNSSNLPVAASKSSETTAITAFFSYVNEKLTIKQAPVRDKTIRRFPLRSSITAFCSALVICALAVCYGIVGLQSSNAEKIAKAEETKLIETSETYLVGNEDIENFC